MEKNTFNLTAPQNSIWLTEQFYHNTNINNICGSVTITQNVNFEFLKKAINVFVQNNDSFRIMLSMQNAEIKQYISDFVPFDVEVISVSSEEDVKNIEKTTGSTVFELINSLLFCFKIFKFDNGTGGFVINAHHIISDSWTLGILINEIIRIYSALLNNENIDSSNAFSYVDYITSEKEYLKSEKFNKDKEYWDSIYSTVPEIATIPSVNKDNSQNASITAERELISIDSNILKDINTFCSENKVSIYNFFMAVISIYLSKVSNLNDFVIGTPILNRTNFKEKHTCGMFINTIPLRINVDSNNSFKEFVSKIALDSIGMLRHQKYSYQSILENLRKQDSSLPNLYNIVLSYQVTKMTENIEEIPHFTRWSFNETIADDIDIHLFDFNNAASLNVAYDYKTDKYSKEDILAMHNRVLNIINQIIKNNEICVKDIEIVTPEEKHQILFDFNNTKVDYPQDKTVVDLFEEQVEKNPDNIAVVFEDKKLTYRELNEKANALAHYLKQSNIKEQSIIGIMIYRSLDTIVSMLAILKANSAYMLIAPSLPDDRILYMLNNANSPLLITSSNIRSIDFENKLIIDELNLNEFSNDNLNLEYNSNNNLAVVYTSGSTGLPKGVLLHQKGMVNLIYSYKEFINIKDFNNFISICSISFDMFAVEVFIPILNGKTLYIANKEEYKDPIAISKLIIDNNIDFIMITPSKIELLLSNKSTIKCLSKLKSIQLGGEALNSNLVKVLQKYTNAQICNEYGPSEITSCCTYKEIISSDDITIGSAISNVQVYILNNDLALCPIGVNGEICVCGTGVSKGYINNQGSTNKAFIKNPFGDGLLYKTGDIGKYTTNGEIEYIGRKDFQIKLRGLRIELSEIEKQLLKINSIKKCAVVYKEQPDNNSYLVAFFTATDENIDTSIIREELSKQLPLYMVPRYIVQLENLPITKNGKVDLKQLKAYEISAQEVTEYTAPENELQQIFCNVWEKLLNTKVGINNNLFELGIDSLLVIKFKVEMLSYGIDVNYSEIFKHPTIKALSEFVNTSSKNIIPKAEKHEYYPVSSAQRRIFYASSLDGNNSLLYNIAGGIILDKKIDSEKLEKCLNTIINRHESLRTYFEIKNENIVQKVIDNIDFKLSVGNSNSSDIDELFKNFVKPFNLSKAPLFDAKLIYLNNEKSLLLLNMHHIISDGTSMAIFTDELSKLYNNETNLPELTIDYKDFSVWENNKINSNEFEADKEYWVNQFQDEIPLLNMPTNYARPNVQSFEGNSIYSTLDENATSKLNAFAKELNITPYMLLLSTYYILLYKYTGQNDIVVGSPILGRDNSELSNIIGMFVNSLALRNKIDSSLSFNEFANIIKENCLKAFEHQTYPFDELVNSLDIKRDTSRNPLFDTMFIYQNNGNSTITFDGIEAKNYTPKNNISKFDLSLELIPENNKLAMRFEYCTKLFTEEFITRLSTHYTNILNAILDNKDIKIADIDMLSEEEKHQILFDFNNTKVDYPQDKTVVDLFEEQVEKNPDNIAVVFEDKKLTYRELNEKANALAHYLKHYNIKEQSIIGIMIYRSLDTIVSMLAILKANSAYMLIDPSLPDDRILYMLNNANSPLLITSSNIRNIDFENKLIIDELNLNEFSNENLNLDYNLDNTFCIIYTSGSTGTPKGVELRNNGVVNLVLSYKTHLNTDICDRFISISTVSFDMFIVETYVPLLSGKTIILTNKEEQKIPVSISNLIKKYDVHFILTTPSRIELLLINEETRDCLKNLKVIQLGGERFTANLFKKLTKYCTANIYNGYGPSEITACCSNKNITSEVVTIGKPFCNTQVYILNKDLNLCPIGMEGEICVCGAGISKGYINNPEATHKAFIKNPFGDGLLYKTGDIGKYTSNGEIEYIGRKDFQIKLRGLRIELSEIEKQLLKVKNIKNCAIIYKEEPDNNSYLAAFFTATDENIDTSIIREELAKHLPLYMVPKYFIQLDSLPITRNGKVDLKILKSYKISTTELTEYTAPENELQKLFCDIWEKLLNTKVGINNDVFELGADSLLAIKFKVEVLSHNIEIQYGDIFKYPTVKALSETNKVSISDNKEVFDYTEINKVLENNNINNIKNILRNTNNNVLLLGSNGFVGMHILYSFIKNDNGKIYCIVRDKNKISARTRFLDALHFYFGNELDEFIDDRIIILKGDITQENFGLNIYTYTELLSNISIVINSSANVRHYGNFKNFEDINIGLTKKAIEFCKKYNKRLIHISSTSVCGNNNLDNEIAFSEKNLYIGQNLDNVYIKSKFEAEKIILNEIPNGLNALILRLGNITNRYSDGKFQINPEENAFIGRLKSLIQLGVIPNALLNVNLEFTPVDLCGYAIVLIMQNYIKNVSVLHLYNSNSISMEEFINYLKAININLNVVDNEEFNNIIKQTLMDENKKDILSGIVNELSNTNDMEFDNNIKIMSEFSRLLLNTLDFNWKKIDNIYVEKYINYMKKIKFI